MCCTQPIVKNCYVSEIFFTTSNQCIYTCLQNISFVNLKPRPAELINFICCTKPIVYNSQKYLRIGIFFTTSNQCIYTSRSCFQNISFVNLKQHPKNNACGYYEHVCKCVDTYLLIHVHQSKFN